jgi:sensor histidine kinase regulating citrate/malate metabolism
VSGGGHRVEGWVIGLIVITICLSSLDHVLPHLLPSIIVITVVVLLVRLIFFRLSGPRCR